MRRSACRCNKIESYVLISRGSVGVRAVCLWILMRENGMEFRPYRKACCCALWLNKGQTGCCKFRGLELLGARKRGLLG